MKIKQEKVNCEHCENRFKSFFCDLTLDELHLLTEQQGCSSYLKGQTIFKEGTYPQGIYCIHSGKVKISKFGIDGKEQIVRLAKESNIIGYRALVSDEPYSSTAIAIEDSSICFFPKEVFVQLLGSNKNLQLQMMKILTSDLKSAENKITLLAQKPVRERIAEALLLMKTTYGCGADHKTLNVILRREEIASIAGTTMESTIRTLSEMNKSKIIEIKGKKLKIASLKSLLKAANTQE